MTLLLIRRPASLGACLNFHPQNIVLHLLLVLLPRRHFGWHVVPAALSVQAWHLLVGVVEILIVSWRSVRLPGLLTLLAVLGPELLGVVKLFRVERLLVGVISEGQRFMLLRHSSGIDIARSMPWILLRVLWLLRNRIPDTLFVSGRSAPSIPMPSALLGD